MRKKVSRYGFLQECHRRLLDYKGMLSLPLYLPALSVEAFLDAVADIKPHETATTLSARHTPRYASCCIACLMMALSR